jgi:chromosome partitioning protein
LSESKAKKVKFSRQESNLVNSKTIAFANQKGGVGKTTCCVNIAAAMAACEKKILLVDIDPQGNATMGSGVNKNLATKTINEVLLGQIKITDAIIPLVPGGYDLLPANGLLTTAEVSLLKLPRREYKLREALAGVAMNYDYICIDCPPSLNMLTINALVAANSVIIPMQCEYYALEGLSALLSTMEQVRAVNPALSMEGIVLTMYDPRNRLATDVEQQLKQHFKDKVYATAIPRNVRLAEAPSHGVPIILYDKNSRGACAYMTLVGEILREEDGLATKKVQRQIVEEIAV